MPNSGLGPRDVHVDRPLTNLSKTFRRPDLVSDMILPPVNVVHLSDTYYVFGREELKLQDDIDIVAPGSPAADFTWRPEGTQVYNAQKRALKMTLADITISNEDVPIRARIRTNEKLNYKVRLHIEDRIRKLVIDPATSSISSTAPLPIKWDQAAGDPEKDIKAAAEFVRIAIGVRPNTILISRKVMDAIVDNFKATADISIGEKATIIEIPDRILGLDVIIADAVKDTTAIGVTPTLADLWPDNVLVFFKDPSVGLDSAGLGWQPRQRGWLTRSWRDEEVEGSVLEVSVIQDEILASPEAGRIIRDVLV